MLVLSRQKNESFIIAGTIKIVVVEIRGNKVRIGIDAPPNISILRQEVAEAIERANGRRQNGKPFGGPANDEPQSNGQSGDGQQTATTPAPAGRTTLLKRTAQMANGQRSAEWHPTSTTALHAEIDGLLAVLERIAAYVSDDSAGADLAAVQRMAGDTLAERAGV